VGPVEVVEVLPDLELLVEIYVVLVVQQLVELLLVRSMRPLHFSVQLGRPGLDVYVPNAGIFDMPVELRLPFMAAISTDLLDAERKFFDNKIEEINRTLLVVLFIYLQCADPCGIVDSRVLVSPDLLAFSCLKRQELNIELNVVTGDFFGVPFGVYFPPFCVLGESSYTVSDKSSIDAVAADFGPVVALKVSHNSFRTEMISLPEMQYFLNGFVV
jgi:hypothetical protein